MIIAVALSVGLLTGLVGVGGGFLIVPALVLFVGLPMKQAVGSSLLVIALNSFVGLAGYVGQVRRPLGAARRLQWCWRPRESWWAPG